MKNTEIEIRVKVDDNGPLLEFLKKHGSFKSEKYQRDEYFTPAHRNFVKIKPIKEWLRLRHEDGRHSLDYKNWHYHTDGKAYHCDEYEVRIDNADKLIHILNALNFEPLIVVNKKRRTYIYKDYEIAIDRVDGLGNYVEVEYKGEAAAADIKRIAEDMKDFIKSSGCRILEQDFAGYPFLLLKKRYGIAAQ